MTDVEFTSTARSGRSRRLRCGGLAAGAVLVVTGTLAPLVGAPGARADQLSDAKAQAAAIQAQLQQLGQHIEVLGQQYDAAQQQVQALGAKVAQVQSQIDETKAKVAATQSTLRQAAVQAYMAGGSDINLDGLFTSGSEQASAAQEYQSVAAGNLTNAIDAYHQAQDTLSAQESQLQASEAQARTAANTVASAQQQAETLQAQQQATLNQVNGQIAAIIKQQQEAAAAAAAAAFAKKQAEAKAAAQAAAAAAAVAANHPSPSGGGGGGGGGGAVTVSGPPPPTSSGASAAVAAAQSQLGVPYVWGGETPGVGFDCSGLTQWSWAQAGVSIPRTAQEQYDAIPHISLADLQPGDLLFWNDGTSSIQHVAMYVGGGQVIQAPYTGSVVSYAAIWTNGLVGAGRP